MKWSKEFPNKDGFFWFYGEPHMGQMGGHFKGTIRPNLKMCLVEIKKISNGFLAVMNGHHVPNTPFDKENKKPGFLGYWAKAELPKPPEDVDGLFVVEEKDNE
jgi:hypothetical protein